MIERIQIEITSGAALTVSDADPLMERCPSCLVILWGKHPAFGNDIAFVRVGTLDYASHIAPQGHYHTASKHFWVSISDNVPTFDHRSDGALVIDNEAQRRLDAVLRRG